MQTFLPFADFKASATVLDPQRLGKQRVETLQLLNANVHGTRHRHHPAAKMWKRYQNALVEYGVTICKEWIMRGYQDTTLAKIEAFRIPGEIIMPKWLGDERLHSNHRARLLEKNPDWYNEFGWKEAPVLKNFWPFEGVAW